MTKNTKRKVTWFLLQSQADLQKRKPCENRAGYQLGKKEYCEINPGDFPPGSWWKFVRGKEEWDT